MTVRFAVYLLIVLVSFLLGSVLFKKLDRAYRWITLLLLVVFISECISRVLAYQQKNSLPTYHVLIPIQYVFLATIYYNIGEKSKFLKMYLPISAFLFIPFCLINTIYLQPLRTFPSNALLLLSLLVIIPLLINYNYILNRAKTVALTGLGLFWFNTGNFIFFTTTFFFWGPYNYLIKTGIPPLFFAYFIWFANIVLYSMYGLAIYFGQKNKPSIQP